MAFKVEVECPKCGNDFEVKDNFLSLTEEQTYSRQAICPDCETDCGEVRIELIIR